MIVARSFLKGAFVCTIFHGKSVESGKCFCAAVNSMFADPQGTFVRLFSIEKAWKVDSLFCATVKFTFDVAAFLQGK